VLISYEFGEIMALALSLLVTVAFVTIFLIHNKRNQQEEQLHKTEALSSKPSFDCERIENLLTNAELSFYHALNQAVSGHYIVMSKVRVADTLKPARGLNNSTRMKCFNFLAKKHFDFVLCQPNTMQIVKAVELNDRSHQRADRKARDENLKAACNSAGLPLYFVDCAPSYSIMDIKSQIL
jgi:hypothetical protein